MRLDKCENTANRRRLIGSGSICDASTISTRTAALQAECCDEKAEACEDGQPQTCNAGCASLMIPYVEDCETMLGDVVANFEPVNQMCQATLNGTSGNFFECGVFKRCPGDHSICIKRRCQWLNGYSGYQCSVPPDPCSNSVEIVCPGGDNGFCVRGQCRCQDGFAGYDCSSPTVPVTVGSGGCWCLWRLDRCVFPAVFAS